MNELTDLTIRVGQLFEDPDYGMMYNAGISAAVRQDWYVIERVIEALEFRNGTLPRWHVPEVIDIDNIMDAIDDAANTINGINADVIGNDGADNNGNIGTIVGAEVLVGLALWANMEFSPLLVDFDADIYEEELPDSFYDICDDPGRAITNALRHLLDYVEMRID